MDVIVAQEGMKKAWKRSKKALERVSFWWLYSHFIY